MDTKKTLCAIGKAMKKGGLVAACDGNISYRRDDGLIVITPSGLPKGELHPKDLLLVNLDGIVVEGTGNRRRKRPSISRFIASGKMFMPSSMLIPSRQRP